MREKILVAALAFVGVVLCAAAPRERSPLSERVTPYGTAGVPFLQTSDAGVAGVTVIGTAATHEQGYGSSTAGCLATTCLPAGDGGTITAAISTRYISTVIGSAVRVANTTACLAFGSTGAGRLLPEGSVLDLIGRGNAIDGGVPVYTCCAEVSGATWQLCPQN